MSDQEPKSRPGCVGTILSTLGVLISGVWLLNLGMGIFELPDNIPFVGNIDEALATGLLIYCLSQLGINTSWLTRGRGNKETKPTERNVTKDKSDKS